LEWLGSKNIFLVAFVIFYNQKWLGQKHQKMSRIEVFTQLSAFFGIDFPYLNNSISRFKKNNNKKYNQTYPFSENIFKKYFLEIDD